MATYTTHYNLKKPASGDYVNVADLNGNADIIDTELYDKVDKETGKGLSANDYTTEEKTKLAGIESGAQVNPSAASANPLMDGTASAGSSSSYARGDHVHPSDTTKVDKETGKGLSTNDYTDEDKAKLAELSQYVGAGIIFDTATGSMASFPDGGDGLPVKNVSVDIDPVQDTSGGAPSPTNICPITGHTSATITRVGKNLLPMTVDSIKANNGGASSWNGNSKTISGVTFTINTDNSGNVISITANGTSSDAWLLLVSFTYAANISYIINGCPAGGNVYTYGVESDNLNMRDIGSGVTILQTSDYTDNIYVYVKIGATINNAVFKPMIRLASDTDPTFEPYQGHIYNVTFPGAAGTVYGGTLDLNAGRLTVDKANIASYSGQSINTPWLSSMDEYAAGRTPTTGAQVVYPLTTPITYSLTAEEITTLLGINHIWADTGDVSVEYVVDPKLYINKVIANALNA